MVWIVSVVVSASDRDGDRGQQGARFRQRRRDKVGDRVRVLTVKAGQLA
jgi:hypothetical protein